MASRKKPDEEAQKALVEQYKIMYPISHFRDMVARVVNKKKAT